MPAAILAYFIPWTGLTDWTCGLSWKQFLNNNPGIIHLCNTRDNTIELKLLVLLFLTSHMTLVRALII